jgi:hypothetical protein
MQNSDIATLSSLRTALHSSFQAQAGSSRIRGWACGLALSLGLVGASSCGTLGTTEMNVGLAEQNITYDLTNSLPLTIPPISCTSDAPCTYLVRNTLGIIDNRITPKCDMTVKQCVADVFVGVVVIIDFSKDMAFTTGLAQSSADAVRDVTLNYALTNNTNFQIDKLDIYVGPDRILSSSDPRAVYLDWIGPVAKGAVYTQEQKPLVIVDQTPPHAVTVEAIRNPTVPLNILVQSYVHLKAGDQLPAGSFSLKLSPSVRFLKR